MSHSLSVAVGFVLITMLFCGTASWAHGLSEEATTGGLEDENEDENENNKIESSKSKGPDWLIVVTPTGGWLGNKTRVSFPVSSTQKDEATLKGDGWGAGLTVVAFYKYVSLLNVFFLFPSANQSFLIGNITYLSAAIPTPVFVEPYIGIGLAVVNTNTDYKDFSHVYKTGNREGHAEFDQIKVDNMVVAPYPKIGAKFKIPLQHWYVTPFYSFMYENVSTEVRLPASQVEILDEDGSREDLIETDAVHVDKEKEYYSHLVGANFFVDFHYFLQLRGELYYNTNHDLWTTRMIGSVLFNKYIGISAYFEYSQKITVTNAYFLIGPAFVISPPGYFDKMMKRRKKK
jgi:hypothetical protein